MKHWSVLIDMTHVGHMHCSSKRTEQYLSSPIEISMKKIKKHDTKCKLVIHGSVFQPSCNGEL